MPCGWPKRPNYAAPEPGYDSFTTTLLVSPYQNHELLAETAERMGREYGVRFLYRDFRPGFRQGQQEARALGFYMQKYCGACSARKTATKSRSSGIRRSRRSTYCHHDEKS